MKANIVFLKNGTMVSPVSGLIMIINRSDDKTKLLSDNGNGLLVYRPHSEKPVKVKSLLFDEKEFYACEEAPEEEKPFYGIP